MTAVTVTGSVDTLLFVIVKLQVTSVPPSAIVAGPDFSTEIDGATLVAVIVWLSSSVA